MDWLATPAAIAGVVLLLVAAWVMHLRPSSAVHRALAILLLGRALLALLVWADSRVFSLPGRLSTYLIIAMPFAAANVAYLYARRGTMGRGRRRERFVLRTLIVAALLVFEAAYLIDHSRYLDAEFNEGPLSLFFPAFLASFALVGLAAALAWHRSEAGSKRQGHFVVALAFLVEPAFETGFRILTWTNGLPAVGTLQLMDLAIRVGMGVLVLTALAVFSASARRGGGMLQIGVEERTAGTLLGIALASGLAAYLGFQLLPIVVAAALFWIMNAFWLLAMALGITYAIVRYRVLESRRMMTFAIKQSTFAAVLGVIFVVASESLEVLIDAPDQTVAIGVAVTLAAAFRLLHRMTGMLVQRLVPLADDTRKGADPAEVYEAALEGILVDGAVTRKERLVLDALVDKLGLDPDEARRLEETVVVRLAAAG